MSELTTQAEMTFLEAATLKRNAASCELDAALQRCRPFMLLNPRIFIDGNQWCALYGENLQDGVAGFGNTPDKASEAFDDEWRNRNIQATPGEPL